jgi:predicted RNA-binding protein with PUA-like domain
MTDPPAIVGTGTVVREGYPDPSAFDSAHEYFDADSDPATPMWYAVDIRGDKRLKRPVTLHDIKANPALAEMALVRVSRLSVVPVTPDEWRIITEMGS